MSGEIRVSIGVEADLFILEYRLRRFLNLLSLSDNIISSILLISRELATNILKYAEGGSISVRREGNKIVIVSAMRSEYSSVKGSLGVGLKIAREYSTSFKERIKPDGSMVFEAEIDLRQGEEGDFLLDIGVASRPRYSEEKSGDFAFYKRVKGGYFVCVIDVLGHGPGAAALAEEARRVLEEIPEVDIWGVYLGLERVFRGTRGGVAFIGMFYKKRLSYISFGDINSFLFTSSSLKVLTRTNGILGKTLVRPKIFLEDLPLTFALVICTDGVKRGFLDSISFEKIVKTKVEDLASFILERFGVKEDDATVVLVKRGWSENG
ncbi:MAG: SpoIIE family protein phosphatase [Synergistetes bacterium]|nr:SpoIIE family protein phosphatase [Synergistota bacterium]MDW8192334.1 SpoIIE family protein phosphatase [Synergistota bacterium]